MALCAGPDAHVRRSSSSSSSRMLAPVVVLVVVVVVVIAVELEVLDPLSDNAHAVRLKTTTRVPV